MVFVGIDVSKDSHSCHILSSKGKTLVDNLVISNDLEGFRTLDDSLSLVEEDIRVALESTGHYSINIESFLRNKGYSVTLLNPLIVDKFKKSQTLRKTKTDKSDAKLIATLLFSKIQEATADVPIEIRELKSLTRNRSRLVKEKSKFKVGSNIKMNVWIDDESYPFMLKVIAVENKTTKFGNISCLKIKPYVMSGRIFKSQEGVTMWVTNDENHVPVEIRAELLVGSLKASLDGYANVKYPLNFSK